MEGEVEVWNRLSVVLNMARARAFFLLSVAVACAVLVSDIGPTAFLL